VCPFPFSRKKAQVEAQIAALKAMQKGIETELRTFTNHLQTVQLSYGNIQKQNVEIISLLKELGSSSNSRSSRLRTPNNKDLGDTKKDC